MSELKDLVSIASVNNVSECASFCFENEGSFFYGKMEFERCHFNGIISVSFWGRIYGSRIFVCRIRSGINAWRLSTFCE